MSSNSSSSSSSSSNSPIFIYSQLRNCLLSPMGLIGYTLITIVTILCFLPLCVFVLYHGVQHHRSGATTSHSDFFTFHMVALELLNVFGSVLFCCSVHAGLSDVSVLICMTILSIHMTGQMLLHVLTCVERYLAVVHPITYLGLRNTVGIRVRNVALVCVWLISIAAAGLLYQANSIVMPVISCTFLLFYIIVLSFCSISILCVLRHSGPAGEGVGRRRVDQTKLRAFYTIMAILGALMFQLTGNVLISALYTLGVGGQFEGCIMTLATFCFSLPSSAAQPLLYLHRAGKLVCCKTKCCESGGENTSTHS